MSSIYHEYQEEDIEDLKKNKYHPTFIVNGLFLLVVLKEATTNLLTCKFQKLLRENIFIKHIFAIFILLALLVFNDTEWKNSPFYYLIFTLFIYIIFILFSKMNLTFTFIGIILLFIIFLLDNHIVYSEINNKISEKNLNKLIYLKNTLIAILALVIIIGFVIYMLQQYKDHKNNWSIIKFLFGAGKCKYMK